MRTISRLTRLIVSANPYQGILWFFFCVSLSVGQVTIQSHSEEYKDPYDVDSVAPKSILFESPGYRHSEIDSQTANSSDTPFGDTLELPEISTKSGKSDSMSLAFKKYWTKLEKAEGMDKLRAQIQSNDIDKTWIPHFYLFDSNLVVFPGWFIIRKKN